MSHYQVNEFTQSQGHGLFWDSQIREKVFSLAPVKNDSKKYDIDCNENKFDSCENVSIKTSQNGGISCGDIIRFYDADFSKKYTIIILRYSQISDKKKIVEVIELDYNQKVRDFLFGGCPIEVLDEYNQMVRSIPPGTLTKEQKKIYKSRKIELEKEYGMVITINPKVDSKSQRRVQCSIKDISPILEKFPDSLISRSHLPEVRGVMISEEITSGPRKRNKK